MIRRFLKLDASERLVVAEAAVALPVAWAALRIAPRRHVVRLLTATRISATRTSTVEPRRLMQLVAAVAAALPLRCQCLERSLAAAWMLRRRGADASIVLGVADARGVFDAHAWVEINGETPAASLRFVPLQRFSS